MKKRIVSLMMAAVLALSLAACGGAGKPAEEAEAPAEETQEEQNEEEQTEEAAEPEDTQTPEAEAEENDETVPEEEQDSVEKLVADTVAYEQGTAGSQLKAAGLAVRFIKLYASGETDICDAQYVTSQLSPEDKEKFISNFVDIIWPVVQGILHAPDEFGGLLGDLGISQEFDQIVSETLTEDDIRVFSEFAEAIKED